MTLNATHDPALKSWVESANQPGTDFPIQNLPFAVFRRQSAAAGSDAGAPRMNTGATGSHGGPASFRVGVAIGDQILDLAALHEARLIKGSGGDALAACAQPTLNAFMALGPDAWSTLRAALSKLLAAGELQASGRVGAPTSGAAVSRAGAVA